MNKEIKMIDVMALAKDLARNATNDQIICYEDTTELNETYCDEEDMFEADGVTYNPEVQKVFDGWVAFYLNHIEACTEPEEEMPVKDYVFLLNDVNHKPMSTVSACTDELLTKRTIEAVNDHFMVDLNNYIGILPLSMSKVQIGETHSILVSIGGVYHTVYIQPILNY